MARLEWVDARLQNWARWKIGHGVGGLGYASVRVDVERVDRSSGYDAPIVVPTSDAEAMVTDQAVMALPSDLRRTVEVMYVHPGSIATKLKLLAVTRPTLYARLERADRAIAGWLTARQQRQQAERARVELLQRGTK